MYKLDKLWHTYKDHFSSALPEQMLESHSTESKMKVTKILSLTGNIKRKSILILAKTFDTLHYVVSI